MAPPRIYADFHRIFGDGSGRTFVTLDRFGALRDLNAAGVRLREGLPLTLWMDSSEEEELEVDAVAVWSPVPLMGRCWAAAYDHDAMRDVPKQHDWNVREPFPCIGCGRDLTEQIDRRGMNARSKCEACGTRLHLAIDPP